MKNKSNTIITFITILLLCTSCEENVKDVGRISSNVTGFIHGSVSQVPSACPIFVDGESDGHDLPRIGDSGKNQWNPKWSMTALKTLEKVEFKRLLDKKLSESEANKLQCPKFNSMSDQDKRKFYIILISSMAHTESGFKTKTYFDENAYAKKMGNTKRIDDSYGLLQIDPGNASGVRKCGVSKVNKSGGVVRGRDNDGGLYDGSKNIECGLVFLKWQLLDSKNKKIFAEDSYWSALRPNGSSSKKTTKKFNSQISQISACKEKSALYASGPNLGEQKVLNSDARCTKVSNHSRSNSSRDKRKDDSNSPQYKNNSSSIGI